MRALATLAGSDRHDRVTVSALCQMANVSRNSLYRYHTDILRTLREHQRTSDSSVAIRQRPADHQQAELVTLRDQTAKLVALVDHYYGAYREAQALLSRREQELAELRRRLDAKPAIIAR
jgi:AcrR family transcriptional regulator